MKSQLCAILSDVRCKYLKIGNLGSSGTDTPAIRRGHWASGCAEARGGHYMLYATHAKNSILNPSPYPSSTPFLRPPGPGCWDFSNFIILARTFANFTILYHTCSHFLKLYHTLSYLLALSHTGSYFLILSHTLSCVLVLSRTF